MDEQRERAEMIVGVEGKKHEDVFDENGKPFWMKFLKADYLEDDGLLKK